ncbi:hypothetical protein [Qipengyuania sediminis]|uniref:hypothetical protein n=1 Tax=Qipengyuania sediminis TaxID=1532023 RepID=UPI00197CD611|nr:hypothetical protein [Qipengyuania sediminis]
MTDASISGPFAALAEDYAAALDWWREAGVDCDYTDAPRSWLRAPQPLPETEASVPAPPRTVPRAAAPALERALAPLSDGAIGGDPAHWPGDLAGFRQFWLAEPSLDPGSLSDRVAPVGEAGAALMVLVGMPEDGDREALLSGSCGTLLSRILAALGVSESEAYLASCLPRCAPMPAWDDLAGRGLAALTCHHIACVAPQRVLAFGREAAMLAEGCTSPLLAAPRLDTLARSPAHKRRFWQQWLEWSATSAN